MCVYIYNGLPPSDWALEVLAAVSLHVEYVKQSTGHTHTGHTDRENTPDTGTHTRTTRPPNEHLLQALNNAQRWRDDGKCRTKFAILCMFSLFCEYINREYVRIHVIHSVNQAKYAIRIHMAARQEYVNTYSTPKAVRQ